MDRIFWNEFHPLLKYLQCARSNANSWLCFTSASRPLNGVVLIDEWLFWFPSLLGTLRREFPSGRILGLVSHAIKGGRQKESFEVRPVLCGFGGFRHLLHFRVKSSFNDAMKCESCKIRGEGQRSTTHGCKSGDIIFHILKIITSLLAQATVQISVHLETLRHSGRNSSHWSYRRDKFSLLLKSHGMPHGKHNFTITILGTYIRS